MIPAQKKAGLAWRDTWASANTGDTFGRAIVTPISNLAQYDGPNPMQKPLGPESAQALNEKNRKLLAGSYGYIIRTRSEFGFGTRPAKPNIGLLTTVTAINGRGPDFENFLKTDVVPTLKKANVSYYSVAQTLFGGDSNEYRTLLLFENFAELGKGHPLERVLGAEGYAKLTQKSGASIAKIERTIIRYLPDLSFPPAARTSN